MLARIVLYIAIGAVAVALLAIIFVICMCRTVKKYMNGDYLSDGKNKDELLDKFDEEYGQEIDEDTSLLISPLNQIDVINDFEIKEEKPQFECFTARTAQHRIKEEGFESPFASRARLKVTFELNQQSRMIIGCIKTIEGLEFEDDDETDPDEICFHVKMIPKRRKQKTVTKWKDPKSNILSLTFLLGPFKKDINPRKKIRIRLYGRKKKFPYSSICYGETFMLVSKIANNEGIITRYKRIHPRTDNSIEDESPLVVAKDGDEDESLFDSLIPENFQDMVESLLESASESEKSDKEDEKENKEVLVDKDKDEKEEKEDGAPTTKEKVLLENEGTDKVNVEESNENVVVVETKPSDNDEGVKNTPPESKSCNEPPVETTFSNTNNDTTVLISMEDGNS